MKTLAAILVETGTPLELATLEIQPLLPGQVLVEIAFSGVCRNQLLECRGFRGHDPYLPHCLGHEGSGTVLEIGPHVTKVKPDDKVILSWIKGSGSDVAGTQPYKWGNRKINAGGITTFQKYSVISENRLTVMPDPISFQDAAFIGCALPTGLGSVFNIARPKPGQSIAVFGTGGVGLCAIAGASIAGCIPIIAVDIRENKLKIARKMGATHLINAAETNPVEAIQSFCSSGLDFAIEASGQPEAMNNALRSVRAQGGGAVIIGNAKYGEYVQIDPKQLNMGKRLLGTWGGGSQPDWDYHRFIKLIRESKINLTPLITQIYGLHEINIALNDLEAGKVGRPLINMDL